MSAPLIPWQPCNVPEEIQAELNRRKVNRSFNYVEASKGGWDSMTGDWTNYRGPMVPWIRCCSNSRGRQFDDKGRPLEKRKEGFVFYGGKNFYNTLGFTGDKGNPSIIGYMPDVTQTPHTIDNDLKTSDYPIHVPVPEIERITVDIQKEHYRRASIEWVCFSKKQLEYMTPYFLVPGISCIIEWGWNHFDPSSLVDLSNTKKLAEYFHNPYPLYTEHILKSKGNYDVIFGIITNFEWSIDGNKIKCKTEITSKDRIYAGLLLDSVVSQKTGDAKKNDPVQNNPMGALTEFIDKNLSQFKNLTADKDPFSIPDIANFVRYIKARRPNNWKEYVYGVFYGRDLNDNKNPLQKEANKDKDFDYVNGNNAQLWLNLGLVIEAINFHSSPLKGMNGQEMFGIDIDDVVIGGHPNLISTNADCLIPNAEAPKYFYGKYGKGAILSNKKDIDNVYKNLDEYKLKLTPHTNATIKLENRASAEKQGKLADWKLQDLCGQVEGAYRDDLDEIINRIRYENKDVGGQQNGTVSFEFPFIYDRQSVQNSKPYPARYSGYLKNIYVSWSFIKSLLNRSDEIKTYPKLVEKILEGINSSCGNFWDFRLVDATGSSTDAPEKNKFEWWKPGKTKVVDYKFMYFANRGNVYTFDYMDSDSILLGLNFKPTLSNPQAIRTIYAPTNNPNNSITLTNGTNELLDYHFEDRIIKADNNTTPLPDTQNKDMETFIRSMRELQRLEPRANSFQITNLQDGQVVIRRLVLPNPQILSMLLDDEDEQNNPKYTGIMPSIQASFTLQGIGGLRTFMMFLVRNLPEPYSHKNIVFRINNVQESIENGKWITTINAGIIPLRGYIKKRLGIID